MGRLMGGLLIWLSGFAGGAIFIVLSKTTPNLTGIILFSVAAIFPLLIVLTDKKLRS